MAKQDSLKQAHEQGFLELSNWGEQMIKRIRMNFNVQRIFNGSPTSGPYKNFWIVNEARKGRYHSTGSAFEDRNLYSTVHNGAGGNTDLIHFFFKHYLYFVDWGVGAGQDISEVPRESRINMKKRYKEWRYPGDRQRRPVIFGAIRGSRFYLGKILQDYWGKEAQLSILYGLGFMDKDNNYIEFEGDLVG